MSCYYLLQLPFFWHDVPYVNPSYLNNWQMYWKTEQVEYVDQTDVLFLSYKIYLEATSSWCCLKNLLYWQRQLFHYITVLVIFIFPVTMYWVHYVSSELCNKLLNIHWDTHASTNASFKCLILVFAQYLFSANIALSIWLSSMVTGHLICMVLFLVSWLNALMCSHL